MNQYSKKLKRSGYKSSTRADIINSAIQTYSNMRQDEDAGRKPLYRPRSWHETGRNLEKENRKSSWAKVGQKPGEVAKATLIICP